MIGAEDVDHAVGALQLLVMIGDVVGEIRRPAVGAHDHAVFVVAGGRRAQPQRAVFLVGEAEFAQALDAGRDRAARRAALFRFARDRTTRRSARRRLAVRARSHRGRTSRKYVSHCGLPASRQRSPSSVANARRRSAAGSRRDSRPSGKGNAGSQMLLVARVERARERVHLRAGVVDQPFGEHVVAGETQRFRQRVADRERAPLHDDQRSGRVRAAEFERDAFALRRAAAVVRRLRAAPRQPRAARRRGASRRLMNPAVAVPSATVARTPSSASARSRIACAISLGARFALRAKPNATLVATSPNSGRRGASNVTSVRLPDRARAPRRRNARRGPANRAARR